MTIDPRCLAMLACSFLLAAALHAQTPIACPPEMPAQVSCTQARDAHGSIVSIAVPNAWNHVLIVAAHGGPYLFPAGAPQHALGYASSATPRLLSLGYAVATTVSGG
jgi:hypothetical protein